MQKLLDLLRKVDEITLLELLEITSDDIVDCFHDKIEDKQSYLYAQLQEQEDELD